MGSSSSSMRAVDVVTTSPAADAATVTIASAKELVDALVCAFCSSTAVATTKNNGNMFYCTVSFLLQHTSMRSHIGLEDKRQRHDRLENNKPSRSNSWIKVK